MFTFTPRKVTTRIKLVFDELSKSNEKLFEAMDKAFASANTAFDVMDKAFIDMDQEFNHGVSITSNNGHVVVTGSVKSVRINDVMVPAEYLKEVAK